MIKLHFNVNGCRTTVKADRFEIVKYESEKSDPLSTGCFMAYIIDPCTNSILFVPFCCSADGISEVVDDKGFPYQVETVFI